MGADVELLTFAYHNCRGLLRTCHVLRLRCSSQHSQPRREDMGLFSFIKEAGEKLFGGKKVEEAAAANDTASLAQLNAEAGAAIKTYIDDFGKVGGVMSSVALVVILFESGMSLELRALTQSIRATSIGNSRPTSTES